MREIRRKGLNSNESGADKLENRNSAEGEAEASVPLLEKEDIVKTLFDVDLTVEKVRLGRYINISVLVFKLLKVAWYIF